MFRSIISLIGSFQKFSSKGGNKMGEWTIEDVATARDFLKAKEDYDVKIGFLGRMNIVAKSFGFQDYNDPLLDGVRSFIASLGGQKGGKRKTPQKEVRPMVTIKDLYYEDLRRNSNMQHFLHPEDDVELINSLNIEKSGE